MTWAIPWSPGSLPLWPCVPVRALKPLQAPILLSQFQSRPLSMGSLAPCLHPFWVRRPLLGCLRALRPWDPPSHLHSAPCLSSGSILRVVPSQGSCRAFLFQLLPLEGGDHPPIPTPSLGCPESLHVSIRHSILVHFQSLLPSLEAANQSPRPGTSYSGKTTPRSFQTRIWMAALELNRQTVCTLIYSVVPS